MPTNAGKFKGSKKPKDVRQYSERKKSSRAERTLMAVVLFGLLNTLKARSDQIMFSAFKSFLNTNKLDGLSYNHTSVDDVIRKAPIVQMDRRQLPIGHDCNEFDFEMIRLRKSGSFSGSFSLWVAPESTRDNPVVIYKDDKEQGECTPGEGRTYCYSRR